MMHHKSWITFVLLVFVSWINLYAAKVEHVILVSVDGLRPDAITKYQSPVIEALKNNGVWADHARTIALSKTLPSHTSMLTGRSFETHKVDWNDYLVEKKGMITVPTCLDFAQNHGKQAAMFSGKEKFKHLNEQGSSIYFSIPGVEAATITNAVVQYVEKKRMPDLLFIHYPELDYAGHAHGWMSKPYLAALKNIDHELLQIVNLMNQAEYKDNTIIILTSDHGGEGTTHGRDIDIDRKIPWIASGGPVRSGWVYTTPMMTYDTAATAVALLGLEVPSEWEGKPLSLPLIQAEPKAKVAKVIKPLEKS